MVTAEPVVKVERRSEGAVAVITLNRPEHLNAFNEQLCVELSRAFEALRQDTKLRAVILTGAGKAFCAGADLGSPPNALMQATDSEAALKDNPVYQISLCPVPVIGAVNGYCITGGLEIALSCDWLLASEKAVFMDTHVKFGLAPCWGLSQRLSRLVGYGRAQMMSYTAARVGAAQAKEWGLVTEVVEGGQLLARAEELAQMVAGNDAEMVKGYKAVVREGLKLPLGQGLALERVRGREHYRQMSLGAVSDSWRAKL